MRILLTVHQFLPEYSAGTEIVAYSVARELIARGDQVEIVTGFPGPVTLGLEQARFDRYEYQGIPVHRFIHTYEPMGGESNIAVLEHNNPLVGGFFQQILREFKPDLVHAYHLARLSVSPLEECARAGVPVVCTATDFWFICPLSQLLLPGNKLCRGPSWNAANCIRHLAVVQKDNLLRRIFYRMPDWLVGSVVAYIRRGWFPPTQFNPLVKAMSARPELLRRRLKDVKKILVPSKTVRDLLVGAGLDAANVILFPYGIDVEHIPRVGGKGEAPRLRVGFIGTLASHKGPTVLVDAIRRLSPDVPIDLSLYGSGNPANPYVNKLRSDAGAEARIRFLGAFDNRKVGEILAELDVLVVPSLWYENTPMVIYEAQAAGCVVVASDLGGMSEMIRAGEDGLLFPPGDSAALAQVLKNLCEDRPMVARLATNAPRPLSVKDQVTRLQGIYRQILGL